MPGPFRVGITRDILDSRGEPAFGAAALEILSNAPNLEWEYLPAIVKELAPEHAARYDAVYVNMARTPAAAVARADCRLRVVARHGVGYDSVDVPAMTRAGIVVTNTPMAMPRPVAMIALTFILAAVKLALKDRLTCGRWDERMDNMGMVSPVGRWRRLRGPHRQGAAADGAGLDRRRCRPLRAAQNVGARKVVLDTPMRRRFASLPPPTRARHPIARPRRAMKPTGISVLSPAVARCNRPSALARKRSSANPPSNRNRWIRPIRCWRWTTSS